MKHFSELLKKNTLFYNDTELPMFGLAFNMFVVEDVISTT